ncbi:hypothetical protein CYMTET_22380 [Cymbomonas tetramitiformis]|uniref:Uncharacterized protein n=1 Tax=Cymbomonas tetramitiformis TaxID=36881 RepID=A0AAE0G0I2_9CHLO|nr:hypothetical protein CYMTET_22380 [Cymbomonas tetramitiformis]
MSKEREYVIDDRPVGTLVINAHFTGLTEALQSPQKLDPLTAEEEMALKAATLKSLRRRDAEEIAAAAKEVAEVAAAKEVAKVAAAKEVAEAAAAKEVAEVAAEKEVAEAAAAAAKEEAETATGCRKLEAASTRSGDTEVADQDVGDPLIISTMVDPLIATSIIKTWESGSAERGGEEVAGLAFGGDAIAESVATNRVANEEENVADDTDQLEVGEVTPVFPVRMVLRSMQVLGEQDEAEFVATNRDQEGMAIEDISLSEMELEASIPLRLIERSIKKRSGRSSLPTRALRVLSIIGLFLVTMTSVQIIRRINAPNGYAMPKTWDDAFDAVPPLQKVLDDLLSSFPSVLSLPKTWSDVGRVVHNQRDDTRMPQVISKVDDASPPSTTGEECSAAALTELAHTSSAQIEAMSGAQEERTETTELQQRLEDEVEGMVEGEVIEEAETETEEEAAAQEEEVVYEFEDEALSESTEIETEQEPLAQKDMADQLEDEALSEATETETEPQAVAQDELAQESENVALSEAVETETGPEALVGEDGVYELEDKALSDPAEIETNPEALAQESARSHDARRIKGHLEIFLLLVAGACVAYAACLAIARRIEAEIQSQVQKVVMAHSKTQARAQHEAERGCAEEFKPIDDEVMVSMARNISNMSLSQMSRIHSNMSLSHLSETETEYAPSACSYVTEAYIEQRVEERMAALERQMNLIQSTVRTLQSQMSYLETARKIDVHTALSAQEPRSLQPRAASQFSATRSSPSPVEE